MKPERWQQIEQLYHSALERKEGQRVAFLDAACAGDDALRREVESLLAHEAQVESFIEAPALEIVAQAMTEQPQAEIGQHVDHYRILSLLGKGGMGEVYLAEDTKLGRRVALKMLPADFTQDIDRVRRFEREARTASALNHPNIITIFEIGRVGDTHYIAMEFVEGQTLRAMIRSERMKLDRLADIATQVASALAAAHQAGVVHRDIKPENIMVRPDGYVKVLDFGLAKLTEHRTVKVDPDAMTHGSINTEPGALLGTTHYMSPEQVRGEEVDRRTDLFSFGVVLYEMATGEVPFKGATSALVFDSILNRAPTPPQRVNPELPSGMARVINQALEKDREQRYQTASEIRYELARLPRNSASKRATLFGRLGELVTSAKRGARRVNRRRRLVPVGLALIVLLAGGLLYFGRENLIAWFSRSSVGGPTVSIKPRRSVMVFGFRNLSGRADASWLSTALAVELTTELAAGEKLRTVSGENVAQMKTELSLAESEGFSKETLGRIRQVLGTDLLVLGSYLAMGEKAGGRIRFDLRLQDTAAGDIIASISESGTETELPEMVSRVGARLREKLGIGLLSAAEATLARASLPSNRRAARLYAEGLAKLRQFDALGARDLLEQAIAAEPDYPLAHAAVAEAWSLLGYDEKAKEEAKKAFDLAARLSQEERLSVEGRYREMTKEWGLATDLYRRLQKFFADNPDYGLRLAEAQTASGQGKEALVTLEALRSLTLAVAEDVRIDLAEAQAAGSLTDFRRQQAIAAMAAEKAKAQGTRLLFAQAKSMEGGALNSLGEVEKAKTAFEEAKQIYSAVGDQRGIAQSLYSLAAVLQAQGDVVNAKKLCMEALAIDRQIGNKSGILTKLYLLGNTFYAQGNYAESRRHYEEALQIAREIGDKTSVALSLNNIANAIYSVDQAGARKKLEESAAIYREIGNKSGVARAVNNIAAILEDQKDLNGAKRNYEEALEIYSQIGEKLGMAVAKLNIAGIHYEQGNISEARRLDEEAIVLCRGIENKSWLATSLFRLAEVLLTEGSLQEARAKHEEVLAIRNKLGEKETIAQSQLALARISIEEGHPEKAEPLAQQAAETFRTIKADQSIPSAGDVLTQSLLGQGKIAEAQKTINEVRAIAAKIEDLDASFPVAITAARVSAASGKFAEAKKLLNSTLAAVSRYGYINLGLEARLALGEIEMKSGQTASGRARLEALEKEAQVKGFGLVAKKAKAAKT